MINISVYERLDYRRFFFTHLQYLDGLCQISNQSSYDTINQFLSSLWVTPYLLAPSSFHEHVDSLIDWTKSEAPDRFLRMLSILRTINHENRIISGYGTNFDYVANPYDVSVRLTRTEAIIYDNNCSCYHYANCTSPAQFYNGNSTEKVFVKGFKVGCTPSESFLISTLECFYDLSCINLIDEHFYNTNASHDDHTSTPLRLGSSRFAANATIADLSSQLFIEHWSTESSFELYFAQCAPYRCSYTYVQKVNSLDTITLVFGIYGGLTIVLKWICPIVIQFFFTLSERRKRRIQAVGLTTIVPIGLPKLTQTHQEEDVTNIENSPASFVQQ